MKQIAISLLYSILFLHGVSQSDNYTDCEPLEEDNRYMWFTDDYYGTLIDNALRCFRLNSSISNDSCIRIWIDDDNFPDTPFIYGIKLFEFGSKKGKYYAQYHTVQWEGGDGKSRAVKCIKKKTAKPLNGWIAFEKTMRNLKLNQIYSIPFPAERDDISMGGRFIELQYLFEDVTYTTNFSATTRIENSKYERVRRFWKLLQLINQEFSIDLLAYSSGHNFVKSDTSTVDYLLVEKEIPLDPVDNVPDRNEPKDFPKSFVGPYLKRMYDVDSISPFVSYMIDTTLYPVNDSIERDRHLDTLPLEKTFSIEYLTSEKHSDGIVIIRTIGSQSRAEINTLYTKAKKMFVDKFPVGIKQLSITEDPALLINALVPAWKAKAFINKIKPENIMAIKVWEIPLNWGYLERNKKNGLVQLWLKDKR